MGAGDHKSGLPILEFNLAARLVFREVILPVRVDGNQRWLSLSGGPLFDERNQFVGYSGIGADLTVARRSENQARPLALFDTLTRKGVAEGTSSSIRVVPGGRGYNKQKQ